jgi:serine/threonine protein kinase
MKPLAPNSMISNRYLVIQMIGKGGMGEVYLAVDQRLGSAVALKRTMFKDNAELGSAFEREAKILGRLRHPVLPKVIDHFIEGNDQYLVMENISGEDLGKRIEAAGKPFPLSWVMFWADQLLDALAYLHSHEPPIIHRDIKPENLKLTDDNHIVLLDFGLSKDFDSNSQSNSLGTGSVVGYSPYFASMEQVRGTGTDARSDLYSFSATIYQLLTHIMPPDSLTRADAMLGGKPDPVQPINSINPEVSAAITEVILKGMAVRQDDRYNSASEMQKELRRAYNDKSSEKTTAPNEASTRMMAVPGSVVASKPQAPVNTNPQVPPSAEQTLILDKATTAPAVQQIDVKTQVLPEGSGIEQETYDIRQGTTINNEDERVATPEPAPAATPVRAAPATRVTEAALPPPVQVAVAASVAPQRKSKAGLVAGMLVGLLIILGLAGGGGWYAYNNYYLPAQVQASPTPTPAPPVSASPTPSPAVMAEASPTPGANTNAADEVTTTAPTSLPSNRTTSPSTRPTPGAVSQNPPKAPAAPKAAPKPKSGDRTIILQ